MMMLVNCVRIATGKDKHSHQLSEGIFSRYDSSLFGLVSFLQIVMKIIPNIIMLAKVRIIDEIWPLNLMKI